MFTDNQRQSWQNIKAPDTLLESTAEALLTESKPRISGFKRSALALIAASLLFIFASVLFIGRTNDAHVFVDGVEITEAESVFALEHLPAPVSRGAVINSSVALTLKVSSETLISVSDGYIDILSNDGEIVFSGKEYTVDNDTAIVWNYPTVNTEHTLLLDGKALGGTVTLVHNGDCGERTITFVKN